jgi:uncharacterized membrane protein YgaE (UPF0421/DUF939 family)
VRVLRATGATILQAAAAAGLAWLLAHDVLGHRNAFFAPIAAVIALGLAPGKRTRRAIEIVLGVGVGIAIGDLLITAIGHGAWQVGLVVLLAMAAAVLLGGGPLVVSQAAASAVLVATVAPSSGGAVQTRFVDALVGGAVGLAVLAVAPRNPTRMVRRAVEPILAELAGTLDDIAAALEARDFDAATRALARARSSDELLTQLQNAVVIAEETVLLAPSQWRERTRINRYVTAARQIGFAVRNTRVLARAGIRAVELEPAIPAELVASVRSLAAAVRSLDVALEVDEATDVVENARAAAAQATLALDRGGGFAIDVLVGQVRSTATDLLRALGIEQAVEQVRAAADERAAR